MFVLLLPADAHGTKFLLVLLLPINMTYQEGDDAWLSTFVGGTGGGILKTLLLGFIFPITLRR